MNMQDLEGHIIKISAHTITVKDENGKTRGMVRNVTSWDRLQFNRQVEFSMNARRNGLKLPSDKERIFLENNQIFYIKNDHNRLYWGENPPDIIRPAIEREEKNADLAAAVGMHVVTVSKILN
jgi:hypothetical protein